MSISNKLQTLWSDEYGRYLVAACDIPEKTVILLENVILHAPADDVKNKTDKTNLCLVCCCPCERHCAMCGWCICSTDCEKVKSQFNTMNLHDEWNVGFVDAVPF
ncbi:hypothetical protein HA402_011168 [Bradysia odoriphaga]|nr:hypothetical protein HA402_011168 [Bradysia odoriphaga]